MRNWIYKLRCGVCWISPPGVLTYGVATFLRSYDLGLEYFVPKVPEITSFFNQKKIKESEKHREIFPWSEDGSIFTFIFYQHLAT
jgi:hypothetical protein